MARSRTISPKFFHNEDLSDMPPEARLLFAGLWTLADRSGRLEDRPKRIQVEVFPYGLKGDIDQLLESLDDGNFIFRYRFNQENFIQIPKWTSYQHPHPHEVESVIPPIPCDLTDFKGCRDLARTSRDKGGTSRAGSSVPSGPSGPSGPSPRARPARGGALPDEQELRFAEWWAIYWRRVARKAALDSFRRKVTTEETFQRVMDATRAQTPTMLARTPELRPHGSTWLNQERWNDDILPESPPARRGHQPYSTPPPNPELTRVVPIAEYPESALTGMIDLARELPDNPSAVEGAARAQAEIERRTTAKLATVRSGASPFAEVGK